MLSINITFTVLAYALLSNKSIIDVTFLAGTL